MLSYFCNEMKGRVSQGNIGGSFSQNLKQESKIHGLLGIHQSIKHFRNSVIHVGTFCHSSIETTSKEYKIPVTKHCFILFILLLHFY